MLNNKQETMQMQKLMEIQIQMQFQKRIILKVMLKEIIFLDQELILIQRINNNNRLLKKKMIYLVINKFTIKKKEKIK